jgi:hypothetical protein
LEFIESREIFKFEDPIIILNNLDKEIKSDENSQQELILNKLESIKLEMDTSTNTNTIGETTNEMNQFLNDLKREFKQLNLKNNMQHITIKTLELDLKSSQEENHQLNNQIINLTQQNHRKKELLDHMTKERRKSEKALEELEKNELSALKKKLIAQEEEIQKLKLENEKLTNLFMSNHEERREYLMNFKL